MQRVAEFMQRLADRVQPLAEEFGGLGLGLVAFVDSSFLTLPEVADLLIVIYTVRSPAEWYRFALITTVGSVAGSFALYLVGRRGGEALLRRKFAERHVLRGLSWFRRYGAWTLVLPAIMPPPMPFKLFVLAAGVAGVPRPAFVMAVIVGRGVRYAAAALLAKWYGAQAGALLQSRLADVMLVAGGMIVLAAIAWWSWRRLGGNRDSHGQPPL